MYSVAFGASCEWPAKAVSKADIISCPVAVDWGAAKPGKETVN